jgi:hypothetical protein
MSLSPEPRESTEYIKPEVVDYGDLAELTAGTQQGWVLDATFPISTRRGGGGGGGGGGGFSVTFP